MEARCWSVQQLLFLYFSLNGNLKEAAMLAHYKELALSKKIEELMFFLALSVNLLCIVKTLNYLIFI